MAETTENCQFDNIKLFHSFVPHKYRLLTMIEFIRRHPKDSIIIACCSTGVAEFNELLCNIFLDLRSGSLHGKQDKEHKEAAIKRFNSKEVQVLFATSLILSTVQINQPTWLIHYDIPKEIPEEIQIIKNIHPQKYLLFIDESHKQYLNLLNEHKIITKDLEFDEKSVPKQLVDKIMSYTQKKNHLLYMASQTGYRDLIQTYVNHENDDIFNARQLNLQDVAINFGFQYPPKVPLTK